MDYLHPEVFFSETKGLRHLHIGSLDWIQGTMSIRKPYDIELEYVQKMMVWLLFMSPKTIPQRHCMQLGLGAGAITKFCHQKLEMQSTAVEINPNVVSLCRAWFHLPEEGDLLNIIQDDALNVITRKELDGTLDAICVDIYDEKAMAPVIDSAALYARCKALLTEDGIMTVNLFGRQHSFNQALENIAKGFKIVLNDRQNYLWQFPPTLEGNTVVFAMKRPPSASLSTLKERAELIEEKWGLPAKKWLQEIRRAQPISAKRDAKKFY